MRMRLLIFTLILSAILSIAQAEERCMRTAAGELLCMESDADPTETTNDKEGIVQPVPQNSRDEFSRRLLAKQQKLLNHSSTTQAAASNPPPAPAVNTTASSNVDHSTSANHSAKPADAETDASTKRCIQTESGQEWCLDSVPDNGKFNTAADTVPAPKPLPLPVKRVTPPDASNTQPAMITPAVTAVTALPPTLSNPSAPVKSALDTRDDATTDESTLERSVKNGTSKPRLVNTPPANSMLRMPPAINSTPPLNRVFGTHKLALVIGNSNYLSNALKNPVNDAGDMAAKLKTLGFDVMHRSDLTKKDMKQVIRDFASRIPLNDVNLFYFAGHGVQVDGENYLIPVDIDFNITKSELPDESVRAATILSMMNEAANKTNLFILDACRDSPFRSFSRSAANRGLATLESGVGTLIAYATSPGSTASDGGGRNGIYTQYLLQNIDKPGLTVEQMFKKVRIDVLMATNNVQVPWENSSLRGDFCFAGCENDNDRRAGDLLENNRKLQEQLDISKQQLKSAETLNTENARLTAQIEEIRRNYAAEQQINAERKNKLTDIQQQKANLEAAMVREQDNGQKQDDLRAQLTALQREKQTLETKISAANQQKSSNETMLTELNRLKTENEKLKETPAPAPAEIATKQSNVIYRSMETEGTPMLVSP